MVFGCIRIYYVFVSKYLPEKKKKGKKQDVHCSDGDVLQQCKVYQHAEALVACSGAAWPDIRLGGKLRTLPQAVISCQGTNTLRHILYFEWMPVNQHVWNSFEGQVTTNFLDVHLAWDSSPILVIIFVLHVITCILPPFI